MALRTAAQGAVFMAALTMYMWMAGPAAPAMAHAELERADPAAGAVLDEPPVEVYLRFTAGIEVPPTAATTPSPMAGAQTPPPAPTASPAAELTQELRTVPWWPFALLLGVAALVGVTLFRRR